MTTNLTCCCNVCLIICFFVLGLQCHLDFIQTCMQRLQVAYDNLQLFKPGEIENETAEMQLSFNTEVHVHGNTCA